MLKHACEIMSAGGPMVLKNQVVDAGVDVGHGSVLVTDWTGQVG